MKRPTSQTVFLGLGANIGDREKYIQDATTRIRNLVKASSPLLSSLIETAPVGGPKQDDYLNAVMKIEYSGTAEDLLRETQQIETELGRKRIVRWGARTIDIDILLFGTQRIESHTLKIPHPLMTERLFVLEPLSELAPDLIPPNTNKTINQLLESIHAKDHA